MVYGLLCMKPILKSIVLCGNPWEEEGVVEFGIPLGLQLFFSVPKAYVALRNPFDFSK